MADLGWGPQLSIMIGCPDARAERVWRGCHSDGCRRPRLPPIRQIAGDEYILSIGVRAKRVIQSGQVSCRRVEQDGIGAVLVFLKRQAEFDFYIRVLNNLIRRRDISFPG